MAKTYVVLDPATGKQSIATDDSNGFDLSALPSSFQVFEIDHVPRNGETVDLIGKKLKPLPTPISINEQKRLDVISLLKASGTPTDQAMILLLEKIQF